MTITGFIAARLAEKEADAQETLAHSATARARGLSSTVWDEQGHSAQHALREVVGMRAILGAHDRPEHYCPLPVLAGRHGQLWTPAEGPCYTLILLASIWSDHLDCQWGWSP